AFTTTTTGATTTSTKTTTTHEYKINNKEDLRELKLIDSIMMEEPCAHAGGQCVLASDCPAGLLAETAGLCPNQQPRGVECCYGMSVKETRCFKLGVCMPLTSFCSDKLIFTQAKDCLDDEKCCIMTA
ncbi:uncharacterized protein LOC113238907, partial [Hyposmocoma kahamanoa]|uniref:uncharacterized protein LOC113238907 n=1 Tax=Hyposmocoma kahamanoa TaxID=1477025 RepID=UPI000E6D8486